MKKINIKQTAINTLLFVVLPFFINIIIESLSHKNFWGGFEKLADSPFVFFCNTLIIAFTLSIGAFFRRYRYLWITIISLIWILLGVSNFLLLCNRVLPLTVHDLQLFDLLSSMMKKYLNPFALAAVSLICTILVIGIIILFLKSAKPEGKYSFKNPLIFFILITSLLCGSLKFATTKGILETRFPELPKSYLKNGFAYSFTLSVTDNGINKVDGYSEKSINNIIKSFNLKNNAQTTTPNIIFLQLESFFDVNSLNFVEFDKNPIPNFTKLTLENASGTLTVPTIGAGTVNTEFEVVTGMRIADFGAGEYPYKTILTKNTCESVANNLKNHGYTSHFIHNYKGTFYGRNIVYANLGYDTFRAIESMSGYDINENGWAKDSVLTRYIHESLESTDGPDLITAISVQAHGGYNDIENYQKHVNITSCKNNTSLKSYEYYVNQLYEVDLFLGELVDSLSQMEEDVILVVYGDHLPSFDLTDSDLSGRNVYQTDYFIWNNIGIDYKDENLHSYQITSKVLKPLNISDGVINACHQNYQNDKKYFYYLQSLEYDILYGKKYAYKGKTPYTVSEMKNSIRTIKIDNIVKNQNKENVYIITGKGFTDKTFVRVGGLLVSTSYINENTIEFKFKKDLKNTPVSLYEKDVGTSNLYYFK